MSDASAIPLPVKHPTNDIARARRVRDESEIEQALAARMALHEHWCSEQKAMIPQAQEALVRLLKAALHGTGDGQSEICRDFLLGLRNGQEHLFNLSRLRRLEIEQWQDCMAVLQLHQYSLSPLHLAIQDGERIWQQLKLTSLPRARHADS
ncbi:hypothetical protein SAMN05216229_10149 [Geopseudomonas sagittaria]|uniref:DUF7673 domain-containing protein n=1 Tax=Geopseudomonas sagittaria TaxID=1135990 RepID=A0A1I5NKM6_9GAMM|nr:hypothetical protein [Pseudomonas sagittaria]SFP22262.1 hypothetical protein SAMN05216229_10149 [Pseudomonas sagittaria]